MEIPCLKLSRVATSKSLFNIASQIFAIIKRSELKIFEVLNNFFSVALSFFTLFSNFIVNYLTFPKYFPWFYAALAFSFYAKSLILILTLLSSLFSFIVSLSSSLVLTSLLLLPYSARVSGEQPRERFFSFESRSRWGLFETKTSSYFINQTY
jgi:hypothetical protein